MVPCSCDILPKSIQLESWFPQLTYPKCWQATNIQLFAAGSEPWAVADQLKA